MQNMSLPCPTGRCYPEQVDRKLDKCSFCDFLKISGSFKSLSHQGVTHFTGFLKYGVGILKALIFIKYGDGIIKALLFTKYCDGIFKALIFIKYCDGIFNAHIFLKYLEGILKALNFHKYGDGIINWFLKYLEGILKALDFHKYGDGIFQALIFLPTVQAVFVLLYSVVIIFGLSGEVSSLTLRLSRTKFLSKTFFPFASIVGKIILHNRGIGKIA